MRMVFQNWQLTVNWLVEVNFFYGVRRLWMCGQKADTTYLWCHRCHNTAIVIQSRLSTDSTWKNRLIKQVNWCPYIHYKEAKRHSMWKWHMTTKMSYTRKIKCLDEQGKLCHHYLMENSNSLYLYYMLQKNQHNQ